MKYVTFLLDGMADYPIDELGGKTPLEYAKTEMLDKLAQNASFGTFLTLPEGFPTSSDVANLSVLGWDLKTAYTGRGAIETYGAGLSMRDDTVAYRVNLITEKDGILLDYSAGHISNEEAKILIETLNERLGNEKIIFYTGVSYRHILHLNGDEFSANIYYAKPDSSHGEKWEEILPYAIDSEAKLTEEILREMIYKSKEILANHFINKKRIEENKYPANLIWPWSGGKKPNMPSFESLYGKKGAVISAVDVILGIGKLGGMEAIKPEGATGFIDTNYENKAKAAVELLKRNDFVYIHLEAIDECGHLGDLKLKIKAIELADKRLVNTFFSEYEKTFTEPLRVLVLPDHPVPVKLRKHTRDKVPFMLWGSGVEVDENIKKYSEANCLKGKYADLKGRELMDLLFSK
ncbi:MAG: cofactor-independent phosphoglycerate mutase [Brevinematales bacterium]|nr:cofactor-independent phosphoglycerate mutase [Brevinematales bacterium]